MLIAQIKPEADAGFLADALLAPIAANLVAHRGREATAVKAGFDALLTGLS